VREKSRVDELNYPQKVSNVVGNGTVRTRVKEETTKIQRLLQVGGRPKEMTKSEYWGIARGFRLKRSQLRERIGKEGGRQKRICPKEPRKWKPWGNEVRTRRPETAAKRKRLFTQYEWQQQDAGKNRNQKSKNESVKGMIKCIIKCMKVF
jgi:hypothetical protein